MTLNDGSAPTISTTTDAGNYTINGQTIETTAENISMTATDNQMVFAAGDNVVKHDGMTFAGKGNVTLKPDSVTLGDGVIATGFGKKNIFVLTEKGEVLADEKIFELTEEVPTGITVTSAQDGFIFSRTLTKESKERLGYYNSPDIGKIFSEKFIAHKDNSYRVTTDLLGLEEVIGISDGAILYKENTLSVYKLITDTEGTFTIGKRAYKVSGEAEVALRVRRRRNLR